MTKSIAGTLKSHLAQENTTLATCYRITYRNQVPLITDITQANPGVVTTEYDHGLTTGDQVQLDEIVGMAGLNEFYFTVTVLTSTTFEIDQDTTGYSAYTSGGEVRKTFGYTNIDQDIEFQGITYKATEGSVPSDYRNLINMSVSDVEMLTSYVANISVSEVDIHNGKLDFAECESFMVNHQDLTQGKLVLISGYAGEMKMHRGHYVNAVQSLSAKFVTDPIKVVTAECQHDIGDAKCTVDLSTYEVTGSVTSLTDNDDFNDSTRTEADDYFNYGVITWTSGNNVGRQMEVKSYANTGGNIVLLENTIYDIQVGDAYKMTPGCDKIKTTCQTKFDNVINFSGFDFLPGAAVLADVGGVDRV